MSSDVARKFRHALGAFTTGVTIVTTRDASGQDVGLTANSFNSVSLEPPLVLWSLSRKARSHAGVRRGCEYFAVHILAADQEALSIRFRHARRRQVRRSRAWRAERAACRCWTLAQLASSAAPPYRYEGGDHEIFVGEVLDFEHFPKPPLIFQRGQYAFAVTKPNVQTPSSTAESIR